MPRTVPFASLWTRPASSRIPPGSAPDKPLAPGVAVEHVFAVVCDEPLRVAEVREVVPLRRQGRPVAR